VQVIRGAKSSEDSIDETDHCGIRWNVRTDLRQYDDKRRLSEIGRLTTHVRSGHDEAPTTLFTKVDRVRDEASIEEGSDDRMTPLMDRERDILSYLRPNPGVLLRGVSQRRQYIDRSHRECNPTQLTDNWYEAIAQSGKEELLSANLPIDRRHYRVLVSF
jgi:hypothetical protein